MAAAAGPDGDDRTFKVDFTDTGEKLLQELLRKKLREFMSAPDDIVEYVILLLRGGVCRNDACQKLDVFLEDDSASFISWLWDHLSTHLHLYVKVQEQNQQQNDDVEAPKEASARPMPSEVLQTSKIQIHSEHTIESSTSTRKQNHREWKGTGWEGNEKFPLRSVLTDILHGEKKRSQKSNEIWHPPLKQQNGRKRDRDDEPQQTKRVLSSRPMLGGGGGASCRLLQFAVRDAVKAVQPANSSAEPASKRLRSLVSAAPADNLRDKKSERSQDCLNDRRSERTRPVLQVQGAALALKAAADSTKVRSTGSVFKRLGQGNVVKQPSYSREEKRDYRDFEPVTAVDELDSDRYGNDEDSEVESGELNMADREAEMSVDSTYDDDLDRDEHITRYQSSGSHEVAFDSVVEKKAILVKCSIEPEMQAIRPSSVINKEQPISSLTGAARKTVVVPAVASTAEPIDYETPKDVHVVKKPNVAPTNANATSLHSNVKEVGHVEIQKDSQRSAPSVSYNTTHPSEDADSRTLYVTNVHFAATKDSLSRHFNKFGAVLKVVIVTNAATGQPTGSAYIEFLHKESAERALSLNGTSFMTRILKVVRRSSHESAQFYGWPGSGRSSLYGRHGRMYPRAVLPGSSFRGRTPMKIGARSLQWKREPSCTDSSAGAKHDMSVPLSSEQVLPPGT